METISDDTRQQMEERLNLGREDHVERMKVGLRYLSKYLKNKETLGAQAIYFRDAFPIFRIYQKDWDCSPDSMDSFVRLSTQSCLLSGIKDCCIVLPMYKPDHPLHNQLACLTIGMVGAVVEAFSWDADHETGKINWSTSVETNDLETISSRLNMTYSYLLPLAGYVRLNPYGSIALKHVNTMCDRRKVEFHSILPEILDLSSTQLSLLKTIIAQQEFNSRTDTIMFAVNSINDLLDETTTVSKSNPT